MSATSSHIDEYSSDQQQSENVEIFTFILHFSKDGKFAGSSITYRSLLWVSWLGPDVVAGGKWLDLMMPAGRSYVEQLYKEATKAGKPLEMTKDLVLGGEKRSISFSFLALSETGEGQNDMLCVARTREAVAEVPVEPDLELDWMESLPLPGFIVNQRYTIRYVNAAALRLLQPQRKDRNTLLKSKMDDVLLGFVTPDPEVLLKESDVRASYEHPFEFRVGLTDPAIFVRFSISRAPESLGEGQYVVLFQEVSNLVAEKEKAKSYEQELATLFENSTEGILIVDPETGSMLNVNQRAADILQLTMDDLLDKNWSEIFMEPYDYRAPEYRRGALNKPYVFEADWIVGKGGTVSLEVSCSTSGFAKNQGVTLAYLRDVSERRRLNSQKILEQKRLKLQEQLGKTVSGRGTADKIFEMVRKGLTQLSASKYTIGYTEEVDGLYLLKEDHLKSTIGRRPAAFLERKIETDNVFLTQMRSMGGGAVEPIGYVTNEIEINGIFSAIAKVEHEIPAKIKRSAEVREMLIAKLGRVYTPKWNFVAFLGSETSTDSRQVITQFLNFVSTTLERHFASEALKVREQKFKSIFEGNLTGMFLLDLSGKIIDCNAAFAQILGVATHRNLIGKKIGDFVTNLEKPRDLEFLGRNSKIQSLESTWRLRSGKGVRVLESLTLIKGDHEQPDFLQGTAIDVSGLDGTVPAQPGLSRFPEETTATMVKFSDSFDLLCHNSAAENFLNDFLDENGKPHPVGMLLITEHLEKDSTVPFELPLGPRHYLLTVKKADEKNQCNLLALDVTHCKMVEKQREAIFRIGKIVNDSAVTFYDACGQIHDELAKVLDTRNLYIATYQHGTNEISLPYVVDTLLPGVKSIGPRKNGKGMTEYVLRKREPILLKSRDIQALIDDDVVEPDGILPMSWMGAPLITNHKAVGLLAIQSYDNENAFGTEDLELLKFASDMVAQVLQFVQAQEELVKSENEFRLLAENAPGVILRINRRSIIEYLNKPNPELGLEVGKSIRAHIPITQWPVFQKKVTETWKYKTQSTAEISMVGADREMRWFSVNMAMFPQIDGKETILLILDEITAKKTGEINVLNALTDGQENERRRIAQELHDGLGQLLSVIKLNLMLINKKMEDKSVLDPVLKVTEDAIAEYRAISHNLIPPALKENGLIKALRDTCRQVEGLTGQEVELMVDGDASRIPQSMEFQMFRIVQELINNSSKHGHAKRVRITISVMESDLVVNVTDNGAGFDPKALENAKGIGVRNIYARAHILGGEVNYESAPGAGTSVTVRAPLLTKMSHENSNR
jgi:PAS domain S-box-containing protein